MNQRATEYNLNKEEFEQLLDLYISTIIDSMSLEDFQQYVRNDMNDFLYKCSESEVINEDVENVNKWSKMPPISDELYNELVKEFNTNSYYFFN